MTADLKDYENLTKVSEIRHFISHYKIIIQFM